MTPYYQRGGITIYHGDCREVLPALQSASVGIVFTSPPYNLSDRGFFAIARDHRVDPRRSKATALGLAGGYGTHGDAMDWPEYREWQQQTLLECWRLLVDNGAIFYNHKPRILDGVVRLPTEYVPNLPLRQIIIWDRVEPGVNVTTTHFAPRHEWVLLIAKPDFRLVGKSASSIGDVWSIQRLRQRPNAADHHPAPFPVALPVRALSASPDVGPVLDPFMGTGSTLIAAKQMGRAAIGIELEERFCELAATRLSQEALPLDVA